jgi:hypothetical protein
MAGHYAGLGKALLHGGDGLALIGGLLFVAVVILAWVKRGREAA